MKLTDHVPQLASLGFRNDSTHPGSSKPQLPVKKAEKQQTDDIIKTSACSEHFLYIATMSSFKDLYFRKTIRDAIQENPDNSWNAFLSLSLNSV
jgi:hypothetical protein